MLSKYEIVGIAVSVLFMAVALYLVRVETTLLTVSNQPNTQLAQLAGSEIVTVSDDADVTLARTEAIREAASASGKLQKMIIDDIKIGVGDEAKTGDTVSVHYIGTLQDGFEFDNSNKRGQPFEFTVGQGRVIKGWDEGVLGMKAGGQRILVIPPDLAYGKSTVGPIPANSTLVFSIELLEIK